MVFAATGLDDLITVGQPFELFAGTLRCHAELESNPTVAIAGGAIAASSRHKTNVARRRTALAHHASRTVKKHRAKMRSKTAMRGLRKL